MPTPFWDTHAVDHGVAGSECLLQHRAQIEAPCQRKPAVSRADGGDVIWNGKRNGVTMQAETNIYRGGEVALGNSGQNLEVSE